jgi:hypothetical protein
MRVVLKLCSILSILQRLVQRHNGTFSLKNSPVNKVDLSKSFLVRELEVRREPA